MTEFDKIANTDKDFQKWMEHKAVQLDEKVGDESFRDVMVFLWMGAPTLLGENWKNILMGHVEKGF